MRHQKNGMNPEMLLKKCITDLLFVIGLYIQRGQYVTCIVSGAMPESYLLNFRMAAYKRLSVSITRSIV